MAKKDPADANDANEANDVNNTKKEKKEKEKKNKKDKEKKGGLLGKIIITVIFLAVIALFVSVLGFNFMGLRERYLRGVIDMIPVVNTLIPAPEIEEEDPRDQMTTAELFAQIEGLQSEVEQLTGDKDDLTRRIGLYTAEIESLRAVAAQQEQFRRDKDEFDRLVALSDPSAYSKFYESISPENADILYREASESAQRDQELRRLSNTVSSMDERATARMLETLILTDMDLVVLLLKNLSSGAAGSIIENMSAENAAAVVKQMAPSEQ